MLKGHSAGDSFCRIQLNETNQEIHSEHIEVLNVVLKRLGLPFGESGLEV